jgi:hypothetical protein
VLSTVHLYLYGRVVDPDPELLGQVGSESDIIVADPNPGIDQKIL